MLYRYFFWLTMAHITTFYLVTPRVFLIGLLELVLGFLRAFPRPVEEHSTMVGCGMAAIREALEAQHIPPPPLFVLRQLDKLEQEASSLG